jgi:hypothetical protein
MPATGKYNLVQIGSIYLTKDGLVSGKPCKTSVKGLDAMMITTAFQVIKALSGKPYLQLSDEQLGRPVSIEYESMDGGVFQDIVDAIQAAIDGLTTITLSVTGGAYGDFSGLTVVPDENPVRLSGDFSNTQVKSGSFHFLTTS